MAPARLEIVVIGAEDVKNVRSSLMLVGGKRSSYVVCWVDPSAKQSTRILRRGGRDPVWNEALSLSVDGNTLADPYACLTLQIMASRGSTSSSYDSIVGTAFMPLHEVARLSTNSTLDNLTTLRVQRPSGRMQGVIKLCVCLVESSLPSTSRNKAQLAQIGQSSSSLDKMVGIPVMGYPSYFRDQHLAPSAPPMPPAPPVNGGGNKGLLLGLLGGALTALFLGDILLQW